MGFYSNKWTKWFTQVASTKYRNSETQSGNLLKTASEAHGGRKKRVEQLSEIERLKEPSQSKNRKLKTTLC